MVCREDRPERLVAELASHRLDVVITDSLVAPAAAIRAYNHLLGESGGVRRDPPSAQCGGGAEQCRLRAVQGHRQEAILLRDGLRHAVPHPRGGLIDGVVRPLCVPPWLELLSALEPNADLTNRGGGVIRSCQPHNTEDNSATVRFYRTNRFSARGRHGGRTQGVFD